MALRQTQLRLKDQNLSLVQIKMSKKLPTFVVTPPFCHFL
jgi:hypothetical protein